MHTIISIPHEETSFGQIEILNAEVKYTRMPFSSLLKTTETFLAIVLASSKCASTSSQICILKPEMVVSLGFTEDMQVQVKQINNSTAEIVVPAAQQQQIQFLLNADRINFMDQVYRLNGIFVREQELLFRCFNGLWTVTNPIIQETAPLKSISLLLSSLRKADQTMKKYQIKFGSDSVLPIVSKANNSR